MRAAATATIVMLAMAGPARAIDVIEPMIKVTGAGLESAGKAAVGALPYGQGALRAYKLVEFTQHMGKAALRRDDAFQRQELLLIEAHAGLLKGLVAQGVELKTDSRAQASMAALARIGAVMNAEGLSSREYLVAITSRHLRYAVAKASFDIAIKEGLETFLEGIGLTKALQSRTPSIRGAAGWVDGRSRFRPMLQRVKWSRFADREKAADAMAAAWTKKMEQKAAEGAFDAILGRVADDAFDAVYAALVEEEPLKPIAPTRVRLAITRLELPTPIAIAPAVAAPQPAAVAAVPLAVVAEPAAVHVEPVQQVIETENRHVRSYWVARPDSAPPVEPEMKPAPAPPEPDPRAEARRLQLHHELMCVGAGNKPGCGNWTGERDKTLMDR